MKKEMLKIVTNDNIKNDHGSGGIVVPRSYAAIFNHFDHGITGKNMEPERQEDLKYHLGRILHHFGHCNPESMLIERMILPVTMMIRKFITEHPVTEKPQVLLLGSDTGYRQMVVIKNISFQLSSVSTPVYKGFIHVGYYSSGKKIRPADLRSLIRYYSFTSENEDELLHLVISDLKTLLKTDNLAIILKLQESEPADVNNMISLNASSVYFEGYFLKEENKKEFFNLLR